MTTTWGQAASIYIIQRWGITCEGTGIASSYRLCCMALGTVSVPMGFSPCDDRQVRVCVRAAGAALYVWKDCQALLHMHWLNIEMIDSANTCTWL